MVNGNNETVSLKLVLIGEVSVGKSSLVIRFVKDKFFEGTEPTIGAAFLTKIVNIGEYSVKLEIWDTAGQERYHSLAPMYYRGAPAAFVVYDITNKASFERARNWVEELRRDNPTIAIGFVGNKSDLVNREVQTKDAEKFAADNNVFFMETSAKLNQNVNELFETIARKIPRNYAKPSSPINPSLPNPGADKPKGNCC